MGGWNSRGLFISYLHFYTLWLFCKFYTVICYHWILWVNQLGYFLSLCFGWILWWRLGYSLWHCIYGSWVWPTWNQFQFLLGALCTCNFVLNPILLFSTALNIELFILCQFLWQIFTIFEHYSWHELDFCLLVLNHTLSSVIDDLENFAVLKIFQWRLKMTKLTCLQCNALSANIGMMAK